MDLQYYGANTISLTYKGTTVVIDDNLSELGAKSITKPDNIALFTSQQHPNSPARLVFDRPGEYETSEISMLGLPVRANMDEEGKTSVTLFKIVVDGICVLITGHIYPEFSEAQLEDIGPIDVLIIPVGGNGYTTDAVGALKIIKDVDPKIVIPTHYDDESLKYPVPQQSLEMALKELAMEPKDTVTKLRIKSADLADDATKLILLKKA